MRGITSLFNIAVTAALIPGTKAAEICEQGHAEIIRLKIIKPGTKPVSPAEDPQTIMLVPVEQIMPVV